MEMMRDARKRENANMAEFRERKKKRNRERGMNETETFGKWRACEEDEDFQQRVRRKTGESERNRKTRG